jgi:hypothetical protein
LPNKKNVVVKSTMFPHQNIHKYTWASADEKIHNQIDHTEREEMAFEYIRCMKFQGS